MDVGGTGRHDPSFLGVSLGNGQTPRAHEHRRNGAAAALEAGFEHHTRGRTGVRRLEIQNLCL